MIVGSDTPGESDLTRWLVYVVIFAIYGTLLLRRTAQQNNADPAMQIPETNSESVFFYGLFMDEGVLRQKGLDPKDFKLAWVEGYGLRIGEKATLEVSETEQVFGSIMNLRAEELNLLYGEESVADYVPVRLTATDMENNRIESTSYILPMDLLSGRNPDYARALLLAADKIGLPDTYLKTIKSWI